MSAHISRVEYHVINGDSQFDDAVAWFDEKQFAIAKAKDLGGNHTVFEVTSYLNDYEAVT